MNRCHLLLLLSLAPAALAQQRAIWLNPELGLNPSKTVAAALADPFEDIYEVKVRSSDSVLILHNCMDYLRVEDTIIDAGPTPTANSLHFAGARCDALKLILGARPATRFTLSGFTFKGLAVRNLPPGMDLIIANEEEARAKSITRRGGSILDMEKAVTLHAAGANEAELATPDWTATLTLLARADFLGDGREELLIRRNAAATGGTYRSTRIFLLSRRTPTSPLKIERTRP